MKITKRDNFRVVVEPRGLGHLGWVRTSDSFLYPDEMERGKEYAARCEDICNDITRHVDNVGRVYVESDSQEVCSFCGRDWELDDDDGLPTCCNEAVEAEKEGR